MSMLVSALVDEVTETFRSYVREQNPTTAMTSTIDSDDLTFTVYDPTTISKGLIQIDDEMVFVRAVDRASSTVTLEPWGRGRSGTTATSHALGAQVTSSPTYPRGRVRDLISGVMQEIFPSLFAVTSTLLTFNPAQNLYALPSDCYHVLQVQHQPPGPSLSWLAVRRWAQNKTPTTVELELYSRVVPGANRVRVTYVKNPPAQLAFTDDLETAGYPVTLRDVIVLGATARLAAFTEASRVQAKALESDARSQGVPAGSAVNLSRYLYQLFKQRIDDEARNLQMRYPYFSHFTR